jgi:hypothetical protein
VANDHFVPQLYLRQFGISRRAINLVTIDPYRFVPNASIAGQCQKADFYEKHIRLNELIKKRETEYALLLREISARRDFNSDEAHHLRLLMTDLHTRTKKSAEESKKLPKRLACEGLRWAIKTGQKRIVAVLHDVVESQSKRFLCGCFFPLTAPA